MSDAPERLTVAKTYTLHIAGAFPRSESGRVRPVHTADGRFLANTAHASRKDVRDAVTAARGAFGGWSRAEAQHRGQVLHRIAEMLEGRSGQFAAESAATGHRSPDEAAGDAAAAVDRLVWYAGWADKVTAVLGGIRAVPGPQLCVSAPKPAGIAGILAPGGTGLLGVVSVLAPALAVGNTCVLVADEEPLPVLTFAEVLATSGIPPGAVNVLTGPLAELGPTLAEHADVDLLDPSGADPELRAQLARGAAASAKRVLDPPPEDFSADPGLRRLRACTERTSVRHPAAAP
ncbi:aldehyde dehydrogenase family protein [Saccharopolyspora sp. HNM0983]|uniref:Aldehyde dehydrogenase family protein n=1 Tax=Saccharopolyspora montiporae TaxID=2781240 RepID=A0A929BAF0_9PSEU|nr:aldehyde dehydrogenase family protein [Saccharopolyspora sp. HNM0983]MBE9375150.1 aldehyde dehydrogenase family protein [Saccharopolyspora sp. HNM0983]